MFPGFVIINSDKTNALLYGIREIESMKNQNFFLIAEGLVRNMTLRYNKSRDELGLLLQDREVMKLLLQAKKRAEIAALLDMPPGSVNESCKRIFKTLNVGGVAELIIKYGTKNSNEENKA